MKRRFLMSLGTLALGWLASEASAGDYPYQRTQVKPAAVPVAAPQPSTVDLLSARLQATFDATPSFSPMSLVTNSPAPPSSGFAVDRPVLKVQPPQPGVIQPVQYVVPSPSGSAGGPQQAIVTIPYVAGPGGPTGCACMIEDCGGSLGGVFSADVGIYLLQPRWNNNPAYRIAVEENERDNRQQKDFTHSLDVGPAFSLSYIGCDGLGVRARYWQLEADADATVTNNGTQEISSAAPLGLGIDGPDNLNVRWVFESDLRIRVVDLEATQNLNWECYTFVVSTGARLAYLTQGYDVVQTIPNDPTPAVLNSSHRFRGAGPTLSVAARRPFGAGGLAAFASTRGSLLYGQHRQSASLATGGVNLPNFLHSSVSQDDLLPVLELEVGAQYSTFWKGLQVFFQAGVVGQSWFGAGNASNTDLLVGSANDNDQANLGFIGALLSAGVDY